MTASPSTMTTIPTPTTGAGAPESRGASTAQLFAERAECSADEQEVSRIEGEIIRINMPIAQSIARRYDGRGCALEDLTQVASLGLVKAVHGFDPSRGSDFIGFAVPTIRGEVRRWFRDSGWAVRPPRSVQELQPRIRVAWESLAQDLGRMPTEEELAAEVQESPEAVRRATSANGCFRADSLSSDEGDTSHREVAVLSTIESGFASAEARVVLGPILAGLDDRERTILDLWLNHELSQVEIGRRIGVSQVQVSRLLAALLKRMRAEIEGAPRSAA